MPLSVRQFGIASFTALYGAVVLWGYGLHAWAPCEDDACCAETGHDHAYGHRADEPHSVARRSSGGSHRHVAAVDREAVRAARCCGNCRHEESPGQHPAAESRQAIGSLAASAVGGRAAAELATGTGWRSCQSNHPLDCAICAFLAKLKQSGPAIQDGPEFSIPILSLAPAEASQLVHSPGQAPTARGPPHGQA